jgi:hypothetical protein
MDTVMFHIFAMPDLIRIGNLIRRYEAVHKALDHYAFLGALHSYGIQQRYELHMYLRVLRELAAHGFDEALCFRVGEPVRASLGWLPMKGDDFYRVLSAFKEAGVDIFHLKTMDWWRQQSLRIIKYKHQDKGEGELYVEIPVRPSIDRWLTYVRLDDGELGEKFTEGIEIRELTDSELEALKDEKYAYVDEARDVFKAMSPLEYLKLAGRVWFYAADIYEDYDYPIQTMNPYVEEGASHVLLMKADAAEKVRNYAPGRLKGDISQYDPSFTYVSTLHKGRSIGFDPGLERLQGVQLITALTQLGACGRQLYQEDSGIGGEGGIDYEFKGSSIYVLDTPEADGGLEGLIGREQLRLLKEEIMPRLGDELYLLVTGAGGRGFYEIREPPTEYIPTALLAKALYLDGDIVEAVKPEVVERGAPKHLLIIESGRTVGEKGYWFGYALALRPRRVRLQNGIHFDEQIGAGIVAPLVEALSGT